MKEYIKFKDTGVVISVKEYFENLLKSYKEKLAEQIANEEDLDDIQTPQEWVGNDFQNIDICYEDGIIYDSYDEEPAELGIEFAVEEKEFLREATIEYYLLVIA